MRSGLWENVSGMDGARAFSTTAPSIWELAVQCSTGTPLEIEASGTTSI
jgi:hypothetical protein